jgi:hypothetical protein
MSLSTMTSKEKTAIAVLGVVILIALIGIGVLAAQLVKGDADEPIVVADTPAPGLSEAQATVTLIAPPSLEGLAQTTPLPPDNQPVLVARQEAVGPLAPVIITNQPLHAGHRYRLEITAMNGAKVAIQGSWGQSATSASGQVVAPQIEFFEGATPYRIDINSPVADPNLWSCSASAGLKSADLLGQSPALVITVWDITGTQ